MLHSTFKHIYNINNHEDEMYLYTTKDIIYVNTQQNYTLVQVFT